VISTASPQPLYPACMSVRRAVVIGRSAGRRTWTGGIEGDRAARSCAWGFGNRKGRTMRRILTLGVLVLATGGMLGFTASAASADGNGAQTTTQHFKNATDTFVDFVPCRDF